MKTVHTLKRVAFKEGSNSEVVVISGYNGQREAKLYDFALMHSTLTEILEEYKRKTVKLLKPHVLDFQLYRRNCDLETQLQMVLTPLDGDRIRFNIHRTCIGIDHIYTTENVVFSWNVDDISCVPEMVNFINSYIRRL